MLQTPHNLADHYRRSADRGAGHLRNAEMITRALTAAPRSCEAPGLASRRPSGWPGQRAYPVWLPVRCWVLVSRWLCREFGITAERVAAAARDSLAGAGG
jgi:hypothetical protein